LIDILWQTLDGTVYTMGTVFLMLFITGIMNEMGLFQRFSYLASPLVSLSRLPAAAASTFVVGLGSALAANAMTARLRHDGQLSDRQAFLSALMNSVPVYFRELFTYQLAFVVPVLGLYVGGAYAVVSLSTGLIKLLIVIILGRAYLAGEVISSLEPSPIAKEKSIIDAGRKSLSGQKKLFLRIASLYFIMTFLVLYLSDAGLLQSLNVAPLASIFRIPAETVIPLTIYVASPKAGIVLLGPLIQNGGISELKALMVLMLGSMFMLPVFTIRSTLPNYTSIFGVRLGVSLTAVSAGISIMVRLLVLLLLLFAT
jgi:hypothetical protein